MRAIQVYGVLRVDIENGRHPAGEALPSLKVLAREFGVAVGTVQQALKRLEEDGLVERRSRQGTFVRDKAPHAGPLAQLQSILASETDAIITQTLDGTIVCWNRGAERLYGYAGAEVIGRPISILLPADRPNELPEVFRRLRLGEKVEPYESLRVCKDGHRVDVMMSVTPLRDASGQVIGATAIGRDLTERNEAERRDREHALMLDAVGDAVIAVDLDGIVRYWNRGAERLYGWTAEEVLGHVGRFFVAPSLSAEWVGQFRRDLAAGKGQSREWELSRKDGSTFLARVSTTALWESDGTLSGFISVSSDLTERKQAAVALEESERRYREVVRDMPVGVVVHRVDGSIEATSEAAIQMLGRQALDPTWDCIHEDGSPYDPDSRASQVALRTGEPVRGDIIGVFRPATKEPIWLHVDALPQRDESGRIDRVIVTFIDITARKQAEEALERSQEWYRSVVEASTDGVIVQSLDGQIMFANPRGASLLGYKSAADLIGKPIIELFPPEERARVVRENRKLIAHGSYEAAEFMARRKDGGVFPVEVSGTAIKNDQGRPVALTGVFRDISGRKRVMEAVQRSERRFRAIFEKAPIGIASGNRSGHVVNCNEAYQEMLGYTEQELKTLGFQTLTHPDDLDKDTQQFEKLVAGELDSYELTKRMIRKDGTPIWVHLAISAIRDSEGNFLTDIALVEDITERKQTEEALRASEERYRAVIETSQDGIIIRDLNGTILVINERGCELLGFDSPEAAVGHKVEEVVTLEERDVLRSSNARLMREGRDAVELTLLGRNGRRFPAELRRTVMKDAEGRPYAATTMIRDVTERKRYEDELRRRALYDPLTGLANRTLFEDRVVRALQTSKRDGSVVSVLLLDLDRFKDVNDTLGHASGDVLLQQVGARFEQELRNVDTVARLGGDEFAILLVGDGRLQAESVATRILAALSEPFEVGAHLLYSNASIGIALSPEHGMDLATLLRRADIAMYTAKRGAHGFMVYEPATDWQSTRRLTLISELQRAIDGNQLVLYYQPLVDTESGAANRVEALVRWVHPELGFVSPGEFVPLAEQTGLIKPLTVWVLNEAMRQVAAWRSGGLQVSVAVNLSTLSFQDRKLVDLVGATLQRHAVPPHALRLEITESALMADPARARDTVVFLRDLGVHVAIDDFGTGYSSLGYLQRLPVHEVKMDCSFVTEISAEHPESLSIVRAMLSLGQSLGMTVVAEGVETQQQLDILTAAGCLHIQGYVFSEPLLADAYAEWLAARETGAAVLKARSA